MVVLNSHGFWRKAWRVPGLLALFVLVGPVEAPAQEWDMQNRLKRIENEVETLSRAVYRGEAPPPGAVSSGGASSADIEIRLQQIETEMRDLRGAMEQQSYEVRQLKNQLERVSSDLELRMNDLEGRGASAGNGASATRYTTMGSPSSSASSNVASSAGNVTSAVGDDYQWSSGNAGNGQQLGSYKETSGGASAADLAAATYENAFSMVKNRQYDRAQVEFETFLGEYPNHALAGNAKYWLGETHYVRGNFETAARIFAEGYQRYPKGSKAADNLLKLGLSLDALGKKNDACVALRQLKKENPAGAAPVLRRADQEMSRLSCS